MEKQEDIFDRIMALPLLSKFAPFYKKHKSVLLYLLFGGLTTVVSIGTYALFLPVVSPLIANIFSWVAAVTFAYVTNRTWVFASKEKGLAIIQEAFAFYGGRVFTLGLEEVVLYVFITLLFFPPLTVKVFAQVIVLILNYVISKLFVFKK
jgi:putative flippase GtrA